MNVALVPIPVTHLEQTEAFWLPYVSAIADRARLDILEMRRKLTSGECQAFLVWEAEENKSHAFMGVNYVMRGNDRVGEIIWLTGENRAQWVHLFADLETYLREHQKCVAIKAIARPGWKKHLEANGFRLTHMVHEKELS